LGSEGAILRGKAGKVVDVIALVGLAIPNFFLGLLFISWFAVSLRVFPATGYVPISQFRERMAPKRSAAGGHAGRTRYSDRREADARLNA